MRRETQGIEHIDVELTHSIGHPLIALLSPDPLHKTPHVRNPISPENQVLGPDLSRDLGPKFSTPGRG